MGLTLHLTTDLGGPHPAYIQGGDYDMPARLRNTLTTHNIDITHFATASAQSLATHLHRLLTTGNPTHAQENLALIADLHHHLTRHPNATIDLTY